MRIPKNLPGESTRRIAVGLASAAVILSFVACSSSDDDSDGGGVVDSGDGVDVDVVDGDADGDGFLDDGIISATLPFQARAFEAEDSGLELATAYGDRTTGPHGLFATIPAGSSTGLIRRTNSFRGHVVSGLITMPFNNEGNPPVLEPGSFFSVAAGDLHSTNCISEEPCEFYLYQDGAFDVFVDGVDPMPEAVEDDGVTSVTIPTIDRDFLENPGTPVFFAQAYGDRAVELPQGFFGIFPGSDNFGGESFDPGLHIHSHGYHAIVLEGIVTNPFDQEENPPQLGPGSYWSVQAGNLHTTACVSEEDCTWFLYSDNDFDFLPLMDLRDLE